MRGHEGVCLRESTKDQQDRRVHCHTSEEEHGAGGGTLCLCNRFLLASANGSTFSRERRERRSIHPTRGYGGIAGNSRDAVFVAMKLADHNFDRAQADVV